MTSAVYLYRMAFDFNDFGGASAMSWLLFIVVALLTYLTNLAFRPRGAQALFRASQALAAVEGRDYVILDHARLKRTRNSQGIMIGSARKRSLR